MWTSADTIRERYLKRLTKLIRDNAEQLADASDVTVQVDGLYCNKAHLIFDELMETAKGGE